MQNKVKFEAFDYREYEVLYEILNNRCIFIVPTGPAPINFAEDIVLNIQKREDRNSIKNQLRFYTLVWEKYEEDGWYDCWFEFVEIVPDPSDSSCPVDFLHTTCPENVKLIFAKYIPNCPQTVEHVAGGRMKMHNW